MKSCLEIPFLLAIMVSPYSTGRRVMCASGALSSYSVIEASAKWAKLRTPKAFLSPYFRTCNAIQGSSLRNLFARYFTYRLDLATILFFLFKTSPHGSRVLELSM